MRSRGINSDLNVQKRKKEKKKNYYSTIVRTKKESLIGSTVADMEKSVSILKLWR